MVVGFVQEPQKAFNLVSSLRSRSIANLPLVLPLPFMNKSIVVKPKRGRPSSGGRHPFVGIRLPRELLDRVADWSVWHEAASRSEAIRRLVELGLKAKK